MFDTKLSVVEQIRLRSNAGKLLKMLGTHSADRDEKWAKAYYQTLNSILELVSKEVSED